jgi:hypothetical protein
LGRSRTAQAYAEDHPRKLENIAADTSREQRAIPTTWEPSPKPQRRRHFLCSPQKPP